MQSSLYILVALVAFSTAKQLNPGPKVSSEALSSVSSSKGPGKRFATQEFTLYLTPSEIKSLQAAKNLENKVSAKEQQRLSLNNYEEDQEQRAWAQYFAAKAAEESREQLQESLYSKTKPVVEIQEENENSFNSELEQRLKEQQIQNLKLQQERERLESEWTRYNPIAAKKQEEALLHEQLQQQWNRLLNHNRAQLKGLAAIQNEKLRSGDSSEKERSILQWLAASNNEEQNKSEIEKEIEAILRDNGDSYWEKQLGQQDRARAETERINQRQPILIQKEVRVIKHHRVPVVEKVKVSVPTPVLIPVPEPYEVKVPHPYPVPLEIVKHIPVPVIRHK